jgi:pimeloyl-ACP methyl ester carboxylesterase
VQISLDGRVLGYDDTAAPGLPLVLVHGFGCDRTVWDPIVAGLSGHRVIRPDLRGCGESEPGDGPALMEVLAGDLAALLDVLQVERAVVAGHSLGGYVTFAFFRMYAERCAGLGFVASHARSDTPEAAAWRESLAQAAERDGNMDAIVAWYAPRLAAPSAAQSGVLDELIALMARQNPRGAGQLLRGMKARLDSADLFADIAVPALVVVGELDALIPLEASRAVADGVAGATLVVLEGIGHSIPLEAPLAAAVALGELLDRSGG